MAFCPKCGAGSNGAFCPQCGTATAQPQQPYYAPLPPKKSNGLAIGLGIAGGVVALGVVGLVLLSGPGDTPSSAPASSSSASSQPNSAAKVTRKPGYVTGIVLDDQGAPLKISGDKINIRVYGTRTSDAREMGGNATVLPGGRFEIKVPDGNYGVTGFVKVDFQGSEYWLSLDPVGGKDLQHSKDGIFKEMRLKLTGPRPGADSKNAYSYYGGHVRMQYQGRTLPDNAQVKFTLSPTTPLADGSQGKSLTYTATGQQLKSNPPFMDIPLARYRITGEVTLANGTKKAALISQATGQPATSQEFTMPPYAGGEGVEGVFLWMMGEQ